MEVLCVEKLQRVHFVYTKVIDSSMFEFVYFCANGFRFQHLMMEKVSSETSQRHCLFRNASFSNVG